MSAIFVHAHRNRMLNLRLTISEVYLQNHLHHCFHNLLISLPLLVSRKRLRERSLSQAITKLIISSCCDSWSQVWAIGSLHCTHCYVFPGVRPQVNPLRNGASQAAWNNELPQAPTLSINTWVANLLHKHLKIPQHHNNSTIL